MAWSKDGVIRIVFFDVGGTLLRTAEPVGRTYARLATFYGWQPSEVRLEEGFRRAWTQRTAPGGACRAPLGKEGWKKIVQTSLETEGIPSGFPRDEYFEKVYAHFACPGAWQDFPGTGALLERLRGQGIRTGILSNWDPRLRRVLEGFRWSEGLDPVLISEELGVEKPDLEIFRRAEASGGWDAAECALIGDDPGVDQVGAEKAGWRWSLVKRPGRGLEEALASLGI